MTEIKKGYCAGCPYDYGKPDTEMAFNLGCLPSIATINSHVADGAWPCHSEPSKVCCGFAACNPAKVNRALRPMQGVH